MERRASFPFFANACNPILYRLYTLLVRYLLDDTGFSSNSSVGTRTILSKVSSLSETYKRAFDKRLSPVFVIDMDP